MTQRVFSVSKDVSGGKQTDSQTYSRPDKPEDATLAGDSEQSVQRNNHALSVCASVRHLPPSWVGLHIDYLTFGNYRLRPYETKKGRPGRRTGAIESVGGSKKLEFVTGHLLTRNHKSLELLQSILLLITWFSCPVFIIETSY